MHFRTRHPLALIVAKDVAALVFFFVLTWVVGIGLFSVLAKRQASTFEHLVIAGGAFGLAMGGAISQQRKQRIKQRRVNLRDSALW